MIDRNIGILLSAWLVGSSASFSPSLHSERNAVSNNNQTQGLGNPPSPKPTPVLPPKAATPTPTVVKQPPVWTQLKLAPDKTMLLDFTGADPGLILSVIGHASGVPIVVDPNLKSPMTIISSAPVHLDVAFQMVSAVLDLAGFDLKLQGTILIVAKRPMKNTIPAPSQTPGDNPGQPKKDGTPPATKGSVQTGPKNLPHLPS